jgi:hypothetical protein
VQPSDLGSRARSLPGRFAQESLLRSAGMNVRLFSMPGSHAATTGQLLFDYKGVDYKRTDLLPVISWVVLKALGFPEVTVPAAKIRCCRRSGSNPLSLL